MPDDQRNACEDIAEMPTVDVIMPTYNAAKYLSIAIESVMAQTFEDWRILIVDDGSTDNTAEIVSGFAKRLGLKLEFIQQANGGPSRARNNAIGRSSADFLAFLDADDIWVPIRLSESLKCFEGRPQVGLTYGFVSRIDPQGDLIDTFAYRQKHGEGRIAPYIYSKTVDLPCATITIRRECIEAVGVFDETLWATEDRDLWLRIAFKYEVALVPHIIALYRTSPYSLTTKTEGMLEAQLQFIEKHYGAPGCGAIARRVALSKIYRQRAEALLIRKDHWAALKSSLRAVSIYPFSVSNARTAGSLLLRCVGFSR
jgi:glycosyltransferase involved in cell wall biosynthesis